MKLPGLHHVTAFARDAQANLDFYQEVLGLRCVKRTVNYDKPSVYHLYYGDGRGTPGSLVTFFAPSEMGQRGASQVVKIAFAVPPGSLDYWFARLTNYGVANLVREHSRVVLEDPDGLTLELVVYNGEHYPAPVLDGPVPDATAIIGLHHASARVPDLDQTTDWLVQVLGFNRVAAQRGRTLSTGEPSCGHTLELESALGYPVGHEGAGTVHHIAWRVTNIAEMAFFSERIARSGVEVTRLYDRQYFRSIYFRVPGGILFELATDGPGFDTDETLEMLGEKLCLPAWLEPGRDGIADGLPDLEASRPSAFTDSTEMNKLSPPIDDGLD